MSQFSYAQYQNVVSRAQTGASNSVKVGFFKLKNDGDEALIRINCSSLDDLQFATVHTVQADGKWMRVSCLNPLGSYSDTCPLCVAAQSGNTVISKASKKIYVQMLVSYKDSTTGTWSAATPAIWERPAGFSRDLANKLRDFGNLKEHVFKVTRNGVAGDMKTTYSLDYIPVFDKPELVSSDFSAFNNFNIAKHSYWEKSIDDINTFLSTGKFPEIAQAASNDGFVTQTQSVAQQTYAGGYVNPTPTAVNTGYSAFTTQATPAAASVVNESKEEAKAEETTQTVRPTRNWF